MIWIVGLIIAVPIVIILIRHAGHPSRTIKRRGRVPVRMCGKCGEPRGKCQHFTRLAEHAEGFHGPLKKK